VVVIPHHNGAIKISDDLQALARTGVIPYNIAGAEKIRHALFAAIIENRLKRLEV
jgi:hypothetical protein